MKTSNLFLGAVLILSNLTSTAQNCPDGYTKQLDYANATLYDYYYSGYANKATGAPDQEFAKLESSKGYLILELDEQLAAGMPLNLIVASYDYKIASGTVEGSLDGKSFFDLQQFSTDVKKPNSETHSVQFSKDVSYVRIKRTKNKLLIDAIESAYWDCQFAPIADKDFVSCPNNNKSLCFTNDLPADGYYNYSLRSLSNPTNGVFSKEATYDEDLCKLGRPAQLTFAYQAGKCEDSQNDQGGSQCNGNINGNGDVYIRISNKDNPADNEAKVYFEGLVSLHDAITAMSSNAGESKFPRDVKIHIMSADKSSVLQFIKIKTECGRGGKLYMENTFGALSLVGYQAEGGESVSMNTECALASNYQPNSNFSGVDVFSVEITNKQTPSQKDTIELRMHILDSTNSQCGKTSNPWEFPLCPNTPRTVCLDDAISPDIKFTFILNPDELEGTLDMGSQDKNTDCCDVNGKPMSLQFLYTPESVDDHSQPSSKGYVLTKGSTNGEQVYVVANNSQLDTNGTIYFKGKVDLLTIFEMTSGSFSSNSYIHILDVDTKKELQLINFHTSCSAPIVIGDRFGYMMLTGSGNNYGSCGGTSNEESCCDVIGKPDKITFTYTNSNEVDNSQPSGKSSVTNYSTPDYGSVYIVASDQSSGNGGVTYFKGNVSSNSQFTIDDQGDKFEANTYLHIYEDNSKTTLIQRVQFHTSCSAPIIPGEQFGLLVLNGIENAEGSCGSNSECENIVTYYPSKDYTGEDTANVITCLLNATSGQLDCDTTLLRFIVSTTPPVAVNDKMDNIQLEEKPNEYKGVFDILNNDFHPYGAPFILQKELIKGPSLPNSSAYIGENNQLYYSVQNLESNSRDTILYKLITDCGSDTGMIELGFEVLPVTWLTFNASLETGPSVLLTWKTADELNNEGFFIERSFDAIDFKEIGHVLGNGTTNSISEYSFNDHNPGSKINYYRLRQVDFDGQFDYSEIRIVSLSEISEVKVIPNPNNGNFLVRWNSIREGMDVGIEVVDMSGVVIYNTSSSNQQNTIRDIPQGVYILRLLSPNGSVTTKRVVII